MVEGRLSLLPVTLNSRGGGVFSDSPSLSLAGSRGEGGASSWSANEASPSVHG